MDITLPPEPLLEVLKRQWKVYLLPLCLSVLDLNWFRDYVRDKLMDLAISAVGPHGRWIVANPVAFTTIAFGLAVFLIIVLVARAYWKESRKPSSIVDSSGQRYTRRENSRLIGGACLLGFLFLVLLIYGTYQYSKPLTELTCDLSSSLPGLSWNAAIKLENTPAARRKYLFDMVTEAGARLSIYVSGQDIFTFMVIDSNGEPYAVHVPLGSTGIPLGEYIYLSCEVGIGSRETLLTVSRNAVEVGRLAKPFRIDTGPITTKRGLVIGNDLFTRQSGAKFKMAGLKIYDQTLAPSCLAALARQMHETYGTALPR